jgi:hydroxymethylbilane synthase
MIPEHRLILGTRGSNLALLQARHVAEKLDAAGLEAKIRVIKTTSEYHPETSLAVLDRRDVFTRQLDDALLAGGIDLAVHSAKDVPTEIPDGISLAAITDRTHPGDALVSDEGYHLLEENGAPALPEGAVVATSSVRRRALLLHLRPDLEVVEIRGNVDTRVRKMREGAADALLLAHAGLERIGLGAPYTLVSHDLFLPAVGQGALAVAVAGDHPLRGRIRETLNEGSTERTVLAERAMLGTLEGGCRVPVGARADILDDGRIRLRGVVVSPDGALIYDAGAAGAEPREVGERVAWELLEKGAAIILEEIREVRS